MLALEVTSTQGSNSNYVWLYSVSVNCWLWNLTCFEFSYLEVTSHGPVELLFGAMNVTFPHYTEQRPFFTNWEIVASDKLYIRITIQKIPFLLIQNKWSIEVSRIRANPSWLRPVFQSPQNLPTSLSENLTFHIFCCGLYILSGCLRIVLNVSWYLDNGNISPVVFLVPINLFLSTPTAVPHVPLLARLSLPCISDNIPLFKECRWICQYTWSRTRLRPFSRAVISVLS